MKFLGNIFNSEKKAREEKKKRAIGIENRLMELPEEHRLRLIIALLNRRPEGSTREPPNESELPTLLRWARIDAPTEG